MTTIYLIRHSKTLKVNNNLNTDDIQIQNEKKCLSLEGEELAKLVLNNDEFNNIDILYSSNYVRAIQTSRYLAQKNNLDINIISDLGERKFGINSWTELPSDFEKNQFLDENYKIGNGESRKEVTERMYSVIQNILKNNKNKRIAIVSHGTAISYLLQKWCNIELKEEKLKFTFNNKVIFDNKIEYCEVFKLEFDNNSLINIENVRFE